MTISMGPNRDKAPCLPAYLLADKGPLGVFGIASWQILLITCDVEYKMQCNTICDAILYPKVQMQ